MTRSPLEGRGTAAREGPSRGDVLRADTSPPEDYCKRLLNNFLRTTWKEIRMSTRRLVPSSALATAAALALIPAGAFGGARNACTHTVTLRNIRFHPPTLSIHRGDSVKW